MSEVHNEQWLSLVREERVVALSLCICFFLVNRTRVGSDDPNSSTFTFGTFSSLITLYSFKSHPLSLCFWNLCFCKRAIPTWNTSLYLPDSGLNEYIQYIFEHSMWLSGKESACQCARCWRRGFNPWVNKIPQRRKWQPTPVFLPGRAPWAEEPNRLQSIGSQRVRHD